MVVRPSVHLPSELTRDTVGPLARVEAPKRPSPSASWSVAASSEVQLRGTAAPVAVAAAAVHLGERLRETMSLLVPRPRRRHRDVAVRLVGIMSEDGQWLLPRHLTVAMSALNAVVNGEPIKVCGARCEVRGVRCVVCGVWCEVRGASCEL